MREYDALPRRLRHAEQWLRCARSDYRRGDLRSVVLRLLLAEAEVRRARESGARLAASEPPESRAGRFPAVALGAVGAAAAVAVVAAYAAFLVGGGAQAPGASAVAAAVAGVEPRGAVQLDAGDFLTLMPAQPGEGAAGGRGVRLFGGTGPDRLWLRLERGASVTEATTITLVAPVDPGRRSGAF